MSFAFQDHVDHKRVVGAQNVDKPIAGRQNDMIQNSSGKYVFEAANRLERFLILGTEDGTYYVSEKKLTRDNVNVLTEALKTDPMGTIDLIVAVSTQGRCIKNDTCIFALAYASAHDAVDVRKYALRQLPAVCRIGTHLFQFMEYAKYFRGRGRAFNNAIKNWYLHKTPDDLAYQVVKYQQRNGWSHRDLLRLCKPTPVSDLQNAVFAWVTGKDLEIKYPDIIVGYELAKKAESLNVIQHLITKYKLTREMVPTQWLNQKGVWERLILNTPYIALLRNLGVMSACDFIKPFSDAETYVAERLCNVEEVKKSKVHPIQVMMALCTYRSGEGVKGSLTWAPSQKVVQALEDAFYLAFGNVEPTGKNYLLALDISGSMAFDNIGGIKDFTPRVASAVMAMVTLRTEPNCLVLGFSHELVPIDMNARSSLKEAQAAVSSLPFGSTNVGLPFEYAIRHKLPIDVFVVYTDNEVTYGQHPATLLKEHRRHGYPNAKLAVVAMTSNGFSIADPNDPGMMDFVGFDTATPSAISAFVNA